jgi:hypothetical protein
VFDAEQDELRLLRVAYDVSRAQQKILDNRLPEFLAHRLGSGS